MTLYLTRAFEVIKLLNERVIALFNHLFLQFLHIIEIGQKAHNTTTSRPSVPCILQILTTFNLYSGRPRVGLLVCNKQKVRQAMVEISRAGGNPPPPLARYVSRNGLTIGGLNGLVEDIFKNKIIILSSTSLLSRTSNIMNIDDILKVMFLNVRINIEVSFTAHVIYTCISWHVC